MGKLFHISILIITVIIGCADQDMEGALDFSSHTVQARDIEVSVDLILNSDYSGAFYVGKIGDVNTDDRKRIYISDKITLAIKRFSEEGTYEMDIGRRGRGMGELMDFNSMMLAQDRLIAHDLVNRKLVYYHLNGRTAEEKKGIIDPDFPLGKLIHLNDHSQIAFLSLHRLNAESINYIHPYDHELNRVAASFGDYHQFKLSKVEPFNHLSMINAGNIAVDPKNNLYITPWVYSGVVYYFPFDSVNNKWRQASIIRGYTLNEESIVENVPDSDYRLSFHGRYFTGKLNHVSVGLFVRGNRVFHFTQMREDDVPQLGVEIFDKDGKFLSYNAITNDFHTSESIPSLEVLHMDQDNNFYLLVNPENILYRFQLPTEI